jgi:hypothetical protein
MTGVIVSVNEIDDNEYLPEDRSVYMSWGTSRYTGQLIMSGCLSVLLKALI